MTVSQSTPHPGATRSRVMWRAVRRTARALKHVHDEQLLMWEGAWRASRFPVDRAGR